MLCFGWLKCFGKMVLGLIIFLFNIGLVVVVVMIGVIII